MDLMNDNVINLLYLDFLKGEKSNIINQSRVDAFIIKYINELGKEYANSFFKDRRYD